LLPARLSKRLPAAAARDPVPGRAGPQPGKKVHAMRQYKYRAVVSLDGAPFSTRSRVYPSGTHAVMIRCSNPAAPAGAFLGPGQRVTLWNGHEIGHGVISRRVFFTTAP
jgi:hypothetical protein